MFQGTKWVEILLQWLLGWCDILQTHLGILCRLPWFINSVPGSEIQLWISKICIHPLQTVTSLSTLPKNLFTKAVINIACTRRLQPTSEHRFLWCAIIWGKSIVSPSWEVSCEDPLKNWDYSSCYSLKYIEKANSARQGSLLWANLIAWTGWSKGVRQALLSCL